MFGLLGREPTITSPDDPYRPEGIDGDVTFDGVTFSHGDRGPVVRNAATTTRCVIA